MKEKDNLGCKRQGAQNKAIAEWVMMKCLNYMVVWGNHHIRDC